MTVHKLKSDSNPQSVTKWARLPIAVSGLKPIDKPGSALKAVFALDIGPIRIEGCKLIHAEGKAPWVAGPSFKLASGYDNPVTWTDRAYAELITAAVLAAL